MQACEEFVQERILDFAGRGIKRHLTMPYDEVDPHCIGCTSCAYVCPTGAIEIVDDLNHPADPQLIRNHGMKINAEMATLDKSQCCMREVGTANIVDVMDKYDLLPVHNYRFGSHLDTPKIDSKRLRREYFTQNLPDGCWHGCSMACAKTVDGFVLRDRPLRGPEGARRRPGVRDRGRLAPTWAASTPSFLVEFNFYCDTYGIDTISFGDHAWPSSWRPTRPGSSPRSTPAARTCASAPRPRRWSCCTRWRAARASASTSARASAG